MQTCKCSVFLSRRSEQTLYLARRGNNLDTTAKFDRSPEETTDYYCNETNTGCSKPDQGSQWATFRFYYFYPTSSSLFDQSLLSSNSNHVASQDSTPQGMLKNVTQLPGTSKDNGRHPLSLPARPSAAPPRRRIMVPHKSQPRDQVMTDSTRITALASTSTNNKRQVSVDSSARPPKRLEDGGKEDMDTAEPSLLSRLTSNGSSARAVPAKRSLPSNAVGTNNDSPHPPGGYSIKGAAKMAARTPPSPERMADRPQTFSLLDRLDNSSSAPSGRKKRKF
jgi:hypothetical protein